MKKILVFIIVISFFKCYADDYTVKFATNYLVNLSIMGSSTTNQHVKYMVKDDNGNIVVSQQSITGNSATLAWRSIYQANNTKLKDNKYTIYIYNLQSKVNGNYVNYALPIAITEHSDYIRYTDQTSDSHPKTATIYGTFGLAFSTLGVFQQNSDEFNFEVVGDDPSMPWKQATSIKSIDSHLDDNAFLLADGAITYLSHQVNLNITVPYVTDMISVKNPLPAYTNSIGYNFAPRL